MSAERTTLEGGKPGNVDRLPEVSRLSTRLADQVLMAQAMDRPVPKGHINALLDAAIILDKYEVELPISLGQILDQIGAAEDDEAGRLAWLFRPFQGPQS